jgi:hypothetical protein
MKREAGIRKVREERRYRSDIGVEGLTGSNDMRGVRWNREREKEGTSQIQAVPGVLRHNDGFYNTCTLKRCLRRKADFKQMQHIMLMFHNCSRYKAGLLQKGCIILYFQIKTNSLKLDAVTKKCFLNCFPF